MTDAAGKLPTLLKTVAAGCIWRGFWPVWALSLLSALSSLSVYAQQNLNLPFELDQNGGKVECLQCVQLWRSASGRNKAAKQCGPNAPTCWGNACFMRQCKHCPVYQYMSGCVDLTPWQFADLQAARKSHELRMHRFGALLLCEDTFNQTTCLCNKKDKCNSIHSNSRVPFSTYEEGLFSGIINFDHVIGKIDPRYLEVITGYQYRFLSAASGNFSPLFYCIVILTSSLSLFYN